jgi:hypothetical protein
MRTLLATLLILGIVLLNSATAQDKAAAKTDKDLLQGSWGVVGCHFR